NVCDAGEASVLPAASVARTSNVCVPSDSATLVNGDTHVSNCAASTRHWNVEPDSSDVKHQVGVASLLGDGAGTEVVGFGMIVSTVKVCEAGEGSVLPAASVARTSKVCEPWPSGAVVCGDTQVANCAPSTRHSNVEPDSLDVKLNVGVSSLPTGF